MRSVRFLSSSMVALGLFVAGAGCETASPERSASGAQAEIADIASLQQRPDGTFDVRCTSGEFVQSVSADDIQSGAVCRPRVRSVALGWDLTCVVTRLGAAKCWGRNHDGQLGNESHDASYRPVDVRGLGADVAKVAAESFSACAVTTRGGVKCWGMNNVGQLGDGSTTERATPVDVVGLGSGVTSVAMGDGHACALLSTGRVKCWGSNAAGQLGTTAVSSSATPVDVEGLTEKVSAITANGEHTCALTLERGVKCWGANTRGQLGDGTTVSRPTPVDVTGLRSIHAISAGLEHTCAITDRGEVTCWGRNDFGQLGIGTTTDSATPQPVHELGAVAVDLTAGGYHTCVATKTGTAKCWGLDVYGQLGDGHATTVAPVPVDVVSLAAPGAPVTGIAAGMYHTCATTGAGQLSCWGYNGASGALGVEGTTKQSAVPIIVWR